MKLFKSKEKLSESESAYLADIEQKIKAYNKIKLCSRCARLDFCKFIRSDSTLL